MSTIQTHSKSKKLLASNKANYVNRPHTRSSCSHLFNEECSAGFFQSVVDSKNVFSQDVIGFIDLESQKKLAQLSISQKNNFFLHEKFGHEIQLDHAICKVFSNEHSSKTEERLQRMRAFLSEKPDALLKPCFQHINNRLLFSKKNNLKEFCEIFTLMGGKILDDNDIINQLLNDAVVDNNDEKILDLIVNKGANTSALMMNLDYDQEMIFPLKLAIKLQCIKAAGTLLRAGADIHQKDEHGRSALHYAAQRKHNFEHLLPLLFTHGANINDITDNGDSALHFACQFGKPDNIAFLLRQGANLNLVNAVGETPLHDAIKSQNPLATEIMIDAGAKVNYRCHLGQTPLHIAVDNGHRTNIDNLIHRGRANINLVCHNGDTPLHRAIELEEDCLDIVKTLVANNADINIQNHQGNTPLHLALYEGKLEFSTFLLENKEINVNLQNSSGETPFHIYIQSNFDNEDREIFLARKADFNLKDLNGNTSLHVAIQLHFFDDVEFLISEANVKLNIRNNRGDSPLHMLYYHSNKFTFGQQFRLETLNLLVKNGVQINSQNDDGDTALHLAVRNGTSLDVHKLLILKNINLTLRNKYNQTPLQEAMRLPKKENEDKIELLLAKEKELNLKTNKRKIDAAASQISTHKKRTKIA